MAVALVVVAELQEELQLQVQKREGIGSYFSCYMYCASLRPGPSGGVALVCHAAPHGVVACGSCFVAFHWCLAGGAGVAFRHMVQPWVQQYPVGSSRLHGLALASFRCGGGRLSCQERVC